MKVNTVLSLDPGDTTGWAVFNTETNKLIKYGATKFTPLALFDLLNLYEPEQIVYERFSLYAHKAESQINSEFYTVQLIGVIKLYCELMHITPIVQSAAVGKSIWSDQMLKKFNYHSDSKHSRDATRHVLTYLKIHRVDNIRKELDNEQTNR